MIQLPANINAGLAHINLETRPRSMFLYGSRARTDFVKSSDYEIGLLYTANKISRHELTEKYQIDDVRLYPFGYEEFVNNQLDTPFPKIVYMRTMIESAKTLFGEKVLEKMDIPKVSLIDLLEEATFQIARAYSAMLSEREGDMVNARAGFVKSCLFGTRCLIILRNKKFPIEYSTIVQTSESLDIEKTYHELIKHSLEVRNGQRLNHEMLFKNISYLNKVVIREIKENLVLKNKTVV